MTLIVTCVLKAGKSIVKVKTASQIFVMLKDVKIVPVVMALLQEVKVLLFTPCCTLI